MLYNSKVITSNQSGVHERLKETVTKHIQHPYRKPYRTHNLDAFASLQKKLDELKPASLVLDSCCGTGMSTFLLAKKYPDSLVVGVDQSQSRISKHRCGELDNCLMLRANCEDIWRLCVEKGIRFDCHYILYPNPWPKSLQMKRRWHGHPVFPSLAPLANKTVVRSNWRLYLEEFNCAWVLLTGKSFDIHELRLGEPISLFEKKYAGSGQMLFEISVA